MRVINVEMVLKAKTANNLSNRAVQRVKRRGPRTDLSATLSVRGEIEPVNDNFHCHDADQTYYRPVGIMNIDKLS